MRPQLETIQIPAELSSINFFRRKTPAFESFWHYHPEIELTFIAEGYGMRIIGDHVASFGANDLVLIGENMPHNYISSDLQEGQQSVAYVFQCSKAMLAPFPECAHILRLFEAAKFGLKFENPSQEIIRKIETFDKLAPLEQLISFIEILDSIAAHSNRQSLSTINFFQNHTTPKYQNRISKVTNFIFEKMGRSIPLDEIAQFAAMTPNGFCRWFKQATGYTFVAYLNVVRIEKACQYLLQTDWLIAEIAYKTGFETITHFNRTFKRIKGESPRSYRHKTNF